MSVTLLVRRYLPAIVSWMAVGVVALGLPIAIRSVLVVGAAVWAPGASVKWLLESTDRLERAVLTVALSLCISIFVAVVLSMFHGMTGLRELAVLATFSAVATTLRVIRG